MHRVFFFLVPEPWGNSECMLLLLRPEAPEGSNPDEANIEL
jgi:hypothetical protein